MDGFTLGVKHGAALVTVELPPSATLQQLIDSIEAQTGVLARKQKLLCKGKVLTALPRSTTLASAGLATGTKLILLAGGGGGGSSESQGATALRSAQRAKATELKQKLQERKDAREFSGSGAAPATTQLESRAATWRKTGIVALRDLKLSDIPGEVFAAGGAIRVADCGGNKLVALPPAISQLSNLQK